MRPDLIGQITSRAGVIRVRNALNPLLWMTAVVFPAGVFGAYWLRDDTVLRYGLAVVATLPVLATMAAYFTYMFRDPDRLQSEEYLLQQQAMEILFRKNSDGGSVDIVGLGAELNIAPTGRELGR